MGTLGLEMKFAKPVFKKKKKKTRLDTTWYHENVFTSWTGSFAWICTKTFREKERAWWSSSNPIDLNEVRCNIEFNTGTRLWGIDLQSSQWHALYKGSKPWFLQVTISMLFSYNTIHWTHHPSQPCFHSCQIKYGTTLTKINT